MKKKTLGFSLLLFTLFFAVVFRTSFSSDFGWHMRTGETIIKTGQIPVTDTYSHTFENYPYIYHSWIAEVIIYLVYSSSGLWGISALYSFLFALGTYFLVREKNFSWLELAIFLAIILELSHLISLRTQTFSYALLAIVYVLTSPDRLARQRSPMQQLMLLIPLLALWANVHPGFLLGIGTAAINLVIWLATKQQALRYWFQSVFILISASLATLINPYTYKLHLFLWQMLSNKTASQYIFDWLPFLELPSLSPKYKLLVVILFAATMIFVKQKVFQRWLLLLFFLFMLQSTRYTLPFALVLFSLLPYLIQELTHWLKRQHKAYRLLMTSILYISLLARLFTYVMTVQASICANQSLECLEEKAPEDFKYPYRAVEYMKQHSLPDNLFNDFNWGGYLIWQLPGRKVFIDGRMDNFYLADGTSFLTVFNTVVAADEGWEAILSRYRINTILVRPGFSLVSKLRHHPDWQLEFENENSIIFTRKNPI